MVEEKIPKKQLKLRDWGPISSIVVTIAGFLLAQIVAMAALGIYAGFRGWDSNTTTKMLESSVWLTFAFSVLVYGLYLWFIKVFLKWTKHSFKDVGWVIPKSLLVTLAYILGGFVIYFILAIVASAITKAVFPSVNLDQKQELGFSANASGLSLIPIFLALVIIPPLAEEIVCRGFLYTGLRKKLHVITAGIITSIIFASAHLQWGSDAPLLWAAAIDTFVLSAVLIYVREKSGSLAAPIGIHMLKNGLAFLALFILRLA